jgi:hypothetical protein
MLAYWSRQMAVEISTAPSRFRMLQAPIPLRTWGGSIDDYTQDNGVAAVGAPLTVEEVV